MRNPFVKLTVAAVSIFLMVYLESAWWLLVYIVPYALHQVFRDTMNVFQWFPFWGSTKRRVYWITRDNASKWHPTVTGGSVYFDITDETYGFKYFHGSGVTFRISHWSFQIGVGKRLKAPPWYRDLDTPAAAIREGVDGVWTEDDPVTPDSDH